jgi:adenosylcobinamide-phosphate synthase
MAAMALALGVRLAKPGGYVLHANGRSATAADTHRAIALAARAVVAVACLVAIVAILLAWARTL